MNCSFSHSQAGGISVQLGSGQGVEGKGVR